MDIPSRSIIKTGGGADIAFAVVVLASYLAMFTALKDASPLEIGLMLVFGTAYIAIGIYGYALCARSSTSWGRLVYFATQIPLGGIIVYLGKGVGFNALLLLPLAGQAVVLLPQRWSYVINGAIILVYFSAVALFSSDMSEVWGGLLVFLAGLAFITIFTQMAVGEERARTEVERLVDELGEANQRLRLYALQIEELATTKERNRLAREIHDGLGHYLTTIHIQIQAARAIMETDPAHASDLLNAAQNLTQEALMDVRQSVSALRLAPESNQPIPKLIAKLLDGCETESVETDLTVLGNVRPLSPQAQLTLYRASQEGINNTRKHAQATQLLVTLDYSTDNQVRLVIQDNGVGTDHIGDGFGLIGLEERLHLIHGKLKTATSPGQGFTLEVIVPG
jgi:signal transduction histidine kinase